MSLRSDELFSLFLDSFVGLEYKNKRKIADRFGGEEEPFLRLTEARAELARTIGEKESNLLISAAKTDYAERTAEKLARRGIEIIPYFSPLYPRQLAETPAPPFLLYAKGNLSLLSSRFFGVVGSRRSLPATKANAAKFTEELIEHGFTVVTGIAEGADSAVLNAGLSHGKIVSVTAGGFDCVYPAVNRSLFDRVAERGLVLSEHPPELHPLAFHFPVRNRIIAGLSEGVLIVSGDEKSGTSYTAGYAADYGREVFAFPYGIGVPSGRGCNRLIKNGAYLTDRIEDILSVYGIERKKEKVVSLTDDERRILALVGEGVTHAERIAEAMGMPVYEIIPVLLELEIKRFLVRGAGNTYGVLKTPE